MRNTARKNIRKEPTASVQQDKIDLEDRKKYPPKKYEVSSKVVDWIGIFEKIGLKLKEIWRSVFKH